MRRGREACYNAAVGARLLLDPVTPFEDPAVFELSLLLVQIAVILIAALAAGRILRHFHQPRVIGEMVAGIVLGPSILGSLAPGLFSALFPLHSLPYVNALSQVGLIVFMFLVGLELDLNRLKTLGRSALIVSQAGVVVPFLGGVILGLFLYPRLSDPDVPFSHFVLFMGVTMSITAFPVLARILTERHMLQTTVGALALASAAVDDVTAWCVLAAVVMLARAGAVALPVWATLSGTLAFVALMAIGARRWLYHLEIAFQESGRVSLEMLGLILVLVFSSALITELLGIHALFGAFLFGVIMPRTEGLARALTERLESLVVVVLLPLFFALTGLRTSVGLLGGWELWLYFVLILLVAVSGKLSGVMVAARLTALPWREAGALGILMNTRGLVELVALNIGLDIGVISPTLFTMMVLMALCTTFMTTPLLQWIYPTRAPAQLTYPPGSR